MKLIAKVKEIKWTKKKIGMAGLILLAIVTLTLFFFGKEETFAYMEVTRQPYSEKIIAVGQLGMENQTQLIAQVTGEIGLIGAKEGETVSAGGMLLSIEDPDREFLLEQKESSYLDAREQYNSLVEYDYLLAGVDLDRASGELEKARKNYSDAQILYKEGAISQNLLMDYQSAYQSAEVTWTSARLKLESFSQGGSKRDSLYYKLESAESMYNNALEDEAKYRIKAEGDTVILGTYFSLGDTVNPGDVLMDIGKSGSYSVTTELDERYFLFLTKGMKVDINLEGSAGQKQLKGEISAISPKINKNTGTFPVEIKVLSEVPYNASDLTVNIEILLKESTDEIVIQKQYLIDETPFVYLYQNGRAVKTEIIVDMGPSANVLVKKGLEEGNLVILPLESLTDGQKVKLGKGVDPS